MGLPAQGWPEERGPTLGDRDEIRDNRNAVAVGLGVAMTTARVQRRELGQSRNRVAVGMTLGVDG